MSDVVSPPPIDAVSLHKTFTGGDGSQLEILRGIDFMVQSSEVVAVIGSSGSGKSTLLHLLGALDRPSSGTVRVGGEDVALMDDSALADLRNRRIGFVFQFHHLLQGFSALENVMIPCLLGGRSRTDAERVARELLSAVGLQDRLQHRPRQLSGGEQQRVAVARALANDPVVLLADEPSGNLDRSTSMELHDLLFELRDTRGLAMVLVTHNLELAGRADTVLELRDGILNGTER